jgi:uncharacterized protein (TIGR00290 family)
LRKLTVNKHVKVAVAWSGGKDSCLACYKAIKEGYDVRALLIMMADKSSSNFHLINSKLLDDQSQSIGIPNIKKITSLDNYEKNFKEALLDLKKQGIEGLVTGDVFDVALHEPGWLDRICEEVDLIPIKPLWHLETKQILNEFITEGFKAIIVRVKDSLLSLEWLGREINEKFFKDLLELGSIDPCGEHGEFHSFVVDGPLFKNRIEIGETEKTALNGYGRLIIKTYEVKSKRKLKNKKEFN